MTHRTRLAATMLSLLWLTACVGPLTQWGEEISLVTRASSFDPSVLEEEQVAVLSAVVGFGLEGYSLQVSRSLSVVLAESERPIQVIPVQEALSQLNREGLATEYAAMVSEYAQSGILDRKVLEKVGEALNVGYVFQPVMAAFSQFTSGRFSFFGLRLFQTRISMLRLSAQLWDTRTGEIAWEASGEAALADEHVRE
ncbi:MAG: hypothetical protein ACE5MM_11255, partial [Nitrospiraceae bacterium]